jgi:hypothetical protein
VDDAVTEHVTGAEERSAQVHQAEGMLAVLLGVPIEQAVVSLDLRAQFRGIPLREAAREILASRPEDVGLDGAPEIGERTLAILRQHFDATTSPLEQSHPR